MKQKSKCPINLSLEILGDKWTLMVIRDIALGGRRHFRELLNQSEERIPANMLSRRLNLLVEQGLLTRTSDPTHKQKIIYSLTERGITLVPVLAQLAVWGRQNLPVDAEHDAMAQVLEDGGPRLWGKLMRNLRKQHL
ncbi:MAG: helix-turn-helix domain-containing protein [Pseudomonadota bacterium]